MRLLIVGMSASIHMARWAAGAVAAGWEVGLFPSGDDRVNAAFDGVTLFQPSRHDPGAIPPGVRVIHAPGMAPGVPQAMGRAASLASAIRRFRPDIVHAQEIQHGGYLAARATAMLLRPPPLILTIWGSDISLQSRVPAERQRIAQTLRRVDVLIADCDRDLQHARRMGYAGEIALAMPVAGGFDLDRAATLRMPGLISDRRTIAIKGYQHFAGRAQVALHALELCGQALNGYRLAVYSVRADEETLARRAAKLAGMELDVVSMPDRPVTHDEMLSVHGRARMSVGLSIADGISTSLLEAMIMGSFPIQSDSACANEWIVDRESAFIVPAEDPRAVAEALVSAARDDDLVDRAAVTNWETAQKRLDFRALQRQIVDLYERVARGS